MNILITDKKVTIEQNGLSSAHNVGSLRYHFTDEGDSVTFKDGTFSVTSPVDQITVNGEQMTSENIDLLLDPIFF